MTKNKVTKEELLRIYNETLKKHPKYKSDSNLEFNKNKKGKITPYRIFKSTGNEQQIIKEVTEEVTRSYESIRPASSPEEEFIHLESCIDCMCRTLEILYTIKDQPTNNPLRLSSYRFAIVAYCIPYTASKTEETEQNEEDGLKLSSSYIPQDRTDLLCLHDSLMAERHKIHAHHELIRMQAKLHVFENNNMEKTTLIAQNKIDYTKYFKEIPKIIELIEATLDNMDKYKKVLINQLPITEALQI